MPLYAVPPLVSWLAERVAEHDDVLPWSILIRGFEVGGVRVPLVSMPGIFRLRACELPLSIRTAVEGPYDDGTSGEGRFRYTYRRTNPDHPDNVGLRELWRRRIPLGYFLGLVPGRYLAAWPVFVIGDDRRQLSFTIQVDDATVFTLAPMTDEIGEERRRYATCELKVRLHQRSFRERILQAYRTQCAICRLKHRELLDAAHIVADREGGEPRVPNGLSLCKLHHAAFDKYFIDVRPDGLIEVRRDILEEQDGPMLLHGLKRLHQTRIYRPRSSANRPDPALLEYRYVRFVRARSEQTAPG